MIRRLIKFAAGLTFLAVLVAVAIPNFQAVRCRRSPRWRCFSNQRTIAGAIEMYNLDFNVNVQGISPRLEEALERLGYIHEFPTDPHRKGERPGRYVLLESVGNGIACTVHGGIQAPGGGYWTKEDFDRLNVQLTGLTLEKVQAMEEALARRPPGIPELPKPQGFL